LIDANAGEGQALGMAMTVFWHKSIASQQKIAFPVMGRIGHKNAPGVERKHFKLACNLG
jgi:hypothetical protein